MQRVEKIEGTFSLGVNLPQILLHVFIQGKSKVKTSYFYWHWMKTWETIYCEKNEEWYIKMEIKKFCT
jgi:hypothetical protein